MAMYIIPDGRMVRRRGWTRRMPDTYRSEDWAEPEYDVLVPVNVKATENEFIITALLPGVKSEDVSIQIVEETVTLQGEIKPLDDDNQAYLLRETASGRFYRSVRLPAQLDSEKAEADLTDGVLTLRVPKAEAVRPRTIKVSAQ